MLASLKHLWHRSPLFSFNQLERDRWIEAQARMLPPGTTVLDVGAGTCPYRGLFSHCQYKAHDFTQLKADQLLHHGQYGAIDFVSDINHIPVPDGSFDAIICTEVLEHVPEPIRAVQEMARILRPGGRLILTAPLGSFLHQEPYHYYGGYTPFWYQKFLPEHGLEVKSIERNRGFFSWFGQESIRFNLLLRPWRAHQWLMAPCLAVPWLFTLPLCIGLFPVLGRFLDRLKLESAATVGYHVAAIKKNGAV